MEWRCERADGTPIRWFARRSGGKEITCPARSGREFNDIVTLSVTQRRRGEIYRDIIDVLEAEPVIANRRNGYPASSRSRQTTSRPR